MTGEEREDTTTYKVVVNDQGQYSLWPADEQNAPGWHDAGKSGCTAACLDYINEIWTDMRPQRIRAGAAHGCHTFAVLPPGVSPLTGPAKACHPDHLPDHQPDRAEGRDLLAMCRGPEAFLAPNAGLHNLVEAQVARTPDAVAVVSWKQVGASSAATAAASTPEAAAPVSQEEQVSFQILNSRANQLAHYLQSLGIGPDVRVGVCMERSSELVVALLGTLKAGGAYVPLDPAYPSDRLSYMLAHAQVPVLLTQERLRDSLPAGAAKIVCLDSEWETIARHSSANPAAGVTLDYLAYVIYTSGSTGEPKGAMIPHRAICNHMEWMRSTWPLTAADAVLQKTPISFDASVWEFWAPLITGARLVMARPGGHKDPAYLAEVIAEHQVTVLQLVPSILQVLLDEPGLDRCQCLRLVYCGGEALSFDLQQRFFTRLNAGLYNLYGPTETAIDVTSWECEREPTRDIVPIGRPITNTQMYVLNARLEPVPQGVAGELYVGGAALGRGYLNRPAMTAERFVPDPVGALPGARLYRTGDRARYLGDGAIEFLGRIDHQVKLRGYRIELREIEATLGLHPGVKEAVVLLREDRPGDKRLVGYLVPREGPGPAAGDLGQFLHDKLPEYMVPSAFLVLARWPLTPNGKIDRRALPAPSGDNRPARSRPYTPPRTKIEELLAGIFATVLGLDRVGVDDNFFELGGHSLLAVRLRDRIEEAFGQRLPLPAIFEGPTIAQLGVTLQQPTKARTPYGIAPIQPNGSRPPFFAMGLVGITNWWRKLGDDLPVYALFTRREQVVRPLPIEEKAAIYREFLQRIQPHGPYFMGGFCYQGIVAFEIAQQLHARGEEVALLALFDAPVPGPRTLTSRVLDRIYYDAFRVRSHGGKLLRLPVKDKCTYLLRIGRIAATRVADAVKRRVKKVEASLRPAARDDMVPDDWQPWKHYLPRPYAGRIVLFLADQGAYRPDPTLGWGKWAAGGVDVQRITGDHLEVFEGRNVELLAERLRVSLECAQAMALKSAHSESPRMPRAGTAEQLPSALQDMAVQS